MTTRPTKKLGEIVSVLRNGKSCKQTKDNIGDKITRIETISDGTINESKVGFYPLTTEDKEKFSIMKGDILFSHINSVEHIGKVALVRKNYNDLFHGMNLLLIRGNKEILDPNFFYLVLTKYFESGYWKNICKKAINQASLNQPNITEIEIPLPPLDIQKAIVTKLDEAFAEIDEAIALTEENISKAEEIKQSVLDKLFETGEYKNIPLSIICTIDPKKAQINNNGDDMSVSFVPMADMNEEKMCFKPKQIRKLGDVRKGYTYFENDDVLLAKVTPCFENGKSGIAKDLENGIGFGSSEYIVLRSNGDVLSKRIYFIVSSKKFRKEGAQNMSGAVGLQRIKKERLHNYNIPLPPLDKQAEIVSFLDQVFTETSALKSDYETKLTHLKELKASILQSAFEGKLI